MNHAHLLFLERAEKVFHESPVEECAVFVGPFHFEVGKFVHFHEWVFGGGNESFLAVEVEKHIDDVAHLGAFGDVALGQEYVAHFACVEVHAEIHFSQHFEAVALA